MVSLSDRSAVSAFLPPVPAILRPEKTGLISNVAALDAEDRAVLAAGLSKRVHGVFASAKNARSVPWATRDQRDLMTLLELDPSVISYREKAERVSVVMDGVHREHVPAFRVRTRNGEAVIDAFPTLGARNESRLRLISALTEVYADRGVPYVALAGTDIRLEPRFGNARWVLAHRGYRPTKHEELLLVGALSSRGVRTLGQLRNELPGVEVTGTACVMAARGSVGLGLSALTPDGMSVRLVGEGAR